MASSLNAIVGGGGKVKDILLNTSHAKTVRALLHFRQDSSFPHPDVDLNVNVWLLSSQKKPQAKVVRRIHALHLRSTETI